MSDQTEYPDGSTPEVDEDGVPVLEDRTDEFPEEAAAATEVVGEPVFVVAGRRRRLGATSGMSAFRGLAAKRAERRSDGLFDPSAHTVAEVTAYLDENPDQAEYVLDRERAGKARVTLIGA